MTISIWEKIAETPWWIYVLYISLIYIGFLGTKARIIPIKQLFILPGMFLILSFCSMYLMHLTLFALMCWIATIVLGMGLGWLQFRIFKIKAVKDEAKLYVPGTWSLLVIILIIFATKYYYGYELETNPQQLLSPKFAAILALIYGFFTGLSIGRASYAMRCLKVGPYY